MERDASGLIWWPKCGALSLRSLFTHPNPGERALALHFIGTLGGLWWQTTCALRRAESRIVIFSMRSDNRSSSSILLLKSCSSSANKWQRREPGSVFQRVHYVGHQALVDRRSLHVGGGLFRTGNHIGDGRTSGANRGPLSSVEKPLATLKEFDSISWRTYSYLQRSATDILPGQI